MVAFQGGNIVLSQAAQTHHFDGVLSERVLIMITKCDVKKYSRQKNDDSHASGGAGEKFKMEMFGAEEPGTDRAEEAEESELSAFPGNGGSRRIFHNFYEAGLLPMLTSVTCPAGPRNAIFSSAHAPETA